MLKKMIYVVLALGLVGCSHSFESYVENPTDIIMDPHFGDYQQKASDLESDYLNKKMTYVEYLQKKKDLDNGYSKEVKERENIISNPSH